MTATELWEIIRYVTVAFQLIALCVVGVLLYVTNRKKQREELSDMRELVRRALDERDTARENYAVAQRELEEYRAAIREMPVPAIVTFQEEIAKPSIRSIRRDAL